MDLSNPQQEALNEGVSAGLEELERLSGGVEEGRLSKETALLRFRLVVRACLDGSKLFQPKQISELLEALDVRWGYRGKKTEAVGHTTE